MYLLKYNILKLIPLKGQYK